MAVVRLKRHLDDVPIDTLILACKRKKTENDHSTSIFKFAATVKDQEENVSKHLKRVFGSEESKSAYKTHNITNITDKLRAENKLFSQDNRLKVVNCFRALNDEVSTEDGSEASGSNRGLTIVDIESLPCTTSETSNNSTTASVNLEDASQKYVYDLYYAPDCELDEQMLFNPISCHAIDNLVFEDYCIDNEQDEDSDDSNDENNWRNDYPDEDPDSIGEEDMKLACQIGGLNLSETNSLSSDGGEEDLVYGIDEPDCSLDINHSDKFYFGESYAAYKKKVSSQLDSDASENSDFCYGDSDLESD